MTLNQARDLKIFEGTLQQRKTQKQPHWFFGSLAVQVSSACSLNMAPGLSIHISSSMPDTMTGHGRTA
jgi:hypothetical protein